MAKVLTRAMIVPVLALVLFLACREEIASDSDTYARQWEALLRASESPDPTPWQNPGSSKMGSGSYDYARKWKARLLACQSWMM